jgi:hypothetical protein
VLLIFVSGSSWNGSGTHQKWTGDDFLWNDSEEDGNVSSECEKMKVLTVKMERVALIGNGS